MKRKYFVWAVVMASSLAFTSCDDFFETDPDDIINEDDYIESDDEMYKGFLGIISKVQEAGDQAIFLTDTRCNFLEVTTAAPSELQDIYNYSNTDNNEYADPSCYYAIIIACNDYFDKMAEYHENVGGMSETSETNFEAMLSCAIRLKVWAYLKLGSIYGEAYWFDDPLTEMYDLSDTDVFTYCDMKDLSEKCLNLLENGMTVDGVDIASDVSMYWYTWLDEESQNEDEYTEWQFITPPRIILEAEWRSWRASYLDEDAAQSDWLWIRDNLLEWLYNMHTATDISAIDIGGFTEDDLESAGYIYQLNIPLQSDATYVYYKIFFAEEGIGNKMQVISAIIYNYTYDQTNRIVQYFCPTYPDAESFYLRPSEYGLNLYDEDDIRSLTQKMVLNTLGGEDCVSKYYYAYNTTTRTYEYLNDDIYKIEPSIIMFRGHDVHFLLAEAENHLGNWWQSKTLLNMGLTNEFADKVLDESWSTYYSSWFGDNGGYGNVGIVGAARGTTYDLPTPEDDDYNLTEDERKQIYDWALADEYLKEFVAEGKSYGYMCKIADRYADPAYRGGSEEAARDSFAARIAPKYTETATQQKVKNYIQSNGYFIVWNLE